MSERSGSGGIVPPVHSRWRPGQSGNPSGKPKGFYSGAQAMADVLSWDIRIVAALAADGLDAECPEGVNVKFFNGIKKRLKPAHYPALAHWQEASNGSSSHMVAAFRELNDRTDGPVRRDISIETTNLDAADTARAAYMKSRQAATAALAEDEEMRESLAAEPE